MCGHRSAPETPHRLGVQRGRRRRRTVRDAHAAGRERSRRRGQVPGADVRTVRVQGIRRARTRAVCGPPDGDHHHRGLPARRPAHHDLGHRRRLFQAGGADARRRHHPAAVLRRPLPAGRDQRRPEQQPRRVRGLADLEPGGREHADRHPPERRVQGQDRGLRHRQHRAEVQQGHQRHGLGRPDHRRHHRSVDR